MNRSRPVVLASFVLLASFVMLAALESLGCAGARPTAATAVLGSPDAAAPPATLAGAPDASAGPAAMPGPATAPSSDALLPLPAGPPGADPLDVAVAASVCAAAYLPSDDGRAPTIGCRSHPPFEKPEQRPDGKLPVFAGDDLLTFCAVQKVYRGSFLRPGARQAVVSFSQCKDNDPGATWDSAFPGSAMLVEEAGDRWKTIAFQDGVNIEACLQDRRADGRDVLLCQSNLWAGSAGHKSYFFALDFGRPDRPVDTLAQIYGDTLSCFALEPAFTLPSGFVSFQIEKTSLSDVDKNGAPDLVVDVSRARAAPSPALDAKVRAVCMNSAQADGQSLLPPPKKTRLVFLAQRDGFSPTPATRQAIDAWKAEAPEHFNGLE